MNKWLISRWVRLLVVLAGIVLGQATLYGPSLLGKKILLPLDILASQNIYLPHTPETAAIQPHNLILSDLIYLFEPERRFAASELHAGRLPMWASYHFVGAPFIWPKFSPFLFLQACWRSPVVLAWVQLLAAMVVGLGTYFFCRKVLTVGLWPAAFAAWCYPLTGFFVLSQGFTLVWSVYWLPWLLLAVDQTIRRVSPLAPIGLSVVTGLTLLSGQLDVGAQVLLVSGCYAVWCWFNEYHKQWFQPQAGKTALILIATWSLGILLASPYVLPVLDYAQNGARVAKRSAGAEERAPVGLAALPQVVLPKMYGSTERGSFPLYPKNQGNLQESTAQTYTGLLATLLVAPFAFCSRRHRPINWFWIILGLLGLSWSLNIPFMVALLRLPVLNMMSHNRLVFATSFAILCLAVTALDFLWQGRLTWRWWFWLVPVFLLGLGSWCAYRARVLPEPIKTEVASALAQGDKVKWVRDLEGLKQVQAQFSLDYSVAAGTCAFGIVGCLFLWRWKSPRRWFVFTLGLLWMGDLIWFGYGRAPQCDPALYYPRLPVLAQLAQAPPGRVIGFNCLPALLATTHELRDIRGYDPIVPARLLELMPIASDPRSAVFEYALMQWLIPRAAPTPEGDIRLSPVLDMLNVRYVIFRGAPIPSDHPFLQGPDYWVVANPMALPRAFIPQRVEAVSDSKARLEKLASPYFDPRAIAYVESPVDLPNLCHGTAEIVDDLPSRVTVTVRMETAGMVVLADLWDKGWRAYLNGKRAQILRVNHAIRGVLLPAGKGTLEFRYEPESFTWGLGLAGLAGAALLAWVGFIKWKRRLRKVVEDVEPLPSGRDGAT